MEIQGGDLPILYILMGILIFLALMAALGTWVRGGGLKREDAEDLFNSAQERNREELHRIEKSLEDSRQANAAAQLKQQTEMASRLQELETILANVAREHGDTLSSGMESVSRLIGDSERRIGQQVETVLSNINNLDSQVRKAGDQVAATLGELMRQQRDQKAQSTIQLCEALITSLGTLKSSIAHQLTEGDPKQTVESGDISVRDDHEYILPAAAPSQWPTSEMEIESEPETISTSDKTEPTEPSWASRFGKDIDHHTDEEEYPLPMDAGTDSLVSGQTDSSTASEDSAIDVAPLDQDEQTKPDAEENNFRSV